MVKRIITGLNLLKTSSPDCIPVEVLKKCQPELLFILAEFLKMYLKEFCFPDCWKVSSAVPLFKGAGERSPPKYYRPVGLLSVISKIFEQFVNNRIADKIWLFVRFLVWFQIFLIKCRFSDSFI